MREKKEHIRITFHFSCTWANFNNTHKQTNTHHHFLHLPEMRESITFLLLAITSIYSQQTGSHYKCLVFIAQTGTTMNRKGAEFNGIQISEVKNIRYKFLWISDSVTGGVLYNNLIILHFLFYQEHTTHTRLSKGAGILQQAALIARIHPVIIGNYLAISTLLMSP